MNLHIRMNAQDAFTHDLHFILTNVVCIAHQLSIEIGHIDGIEINQCHFFNTTSHQTFNGEPTDTTTAKDCYMSVFYFLKMIRSDQIFDADVWMSLRYEPTFYKISTLEE